MMQREVCPCRKEIPASEEDAGILQNTLKSVSQCNDSDKHVPAKAHWLRGNLFAVRMRSPAAFVLVSMRMGI